MNIRSVCGMNIRSVCGMNIIIKYFFYSYNHPISFILV
jgi:hypothetical protein